MKKTKIIILIMALLLFATDVLAHPGNTDSNGGHYNHSTGGYHYHHGESAHQHYSWGCPYDYWWVPILIFLMIIVCILLFLYVKEKALESREKKEKKHDIPFFIMVKKFIVEIFSMCFIGLVVLIPTLVFFGLIWLISLVF